MLNANPKMLVQALRSILCPADFAPSGHFGLLGMYERADLIGAKLVIISSLGKGTQLKIQLS
jgi:signal transduction histidine kinase